MAQSNKEIMKVINDMEDLSLLDKLKDITEWEQSVEDNAHWLKSSKYNMMVAYEDGIVTRHQNNIAAEIKSKKTISFVKALVDMYVAAEALDKENGALPEVGLTAMHKELTRSRPIIFEGFPPIGEGM